MNRLFTFDHLKWLYPGMHIKRWLALVLIGVAIMGLGFGYILREVYLNYTFPDWVYYLTLQFVPRFARAALFIGVSMSLIMFGVWRLNTSLLAAFIRPSGDDSLVEAVYRYRYQMRGPKVVAIGEAGHPGNVQGFVDGGCRIRVSTAQHALVRRASQPDDGAHRQRQLGRRLLLDECHPARALASGEGQQIDGTSGRHRSRGRSFDARDGAQPGLVDLQVAADRREQQPALRRIEEHRLGRGRFRDTQERRDFGDRRAARRRNHRGWRMEDRGWLS